MKNTAVRNEVIVGIDPRELSVPALAWAVDEAVRRRSSLRLGDGGTAPARRAAHRRTLASHDAQGPGRRRAR